MNTHPTTAPNPYAPRTDRRTTPGPVVAAVVVGTVALLTSPVVVGGALGVIGLVVGLFALRAARRSGAGRGMARTGSALSALAVVVAVVMAVFAVWFADRTRDCYQYREPGQWVQCVQQQYDRG
ncbi:DUF4190 domain-containing protein [Kitasatospora sp. NPDC092948]|uniref:DUF4190 domain-containing protein n=1 Tax=Kitasatospora sp. NPDC092948 TaxID=3364088 RepID=UPI00382A58F7